MQRPARASDPERRSDAIRIARVLCILGVIYVHAWTGLDGGGLAAARGSAQENLRWVLMETFGRSAVPLLGVISGWLVAGSSRIGDWRGHVTRKARTILLPMVLWNVIAVSLVAIAAIWFDLRAPIPPSLQWLVEEIFVLARNPDVNVQMPFLRDLFVCMVAAPLLARLSSRSLLAVAAIAALAQITGFGWPLLLRPSILAFFALGMAARREGMAERIAAWPLFPTLAPFAVLLTAKIAIDLKDPGLLQNPTGTAIDLVARLAAAVALWRVTWALAGPSPAARRIAAPLLRIEPAAFLIFCAHLTLMWLFGPLIGRLTGPLGSPLYLPFLILQPLLILGAVLILARILTRWTPAAARVLSGGRLGGTAIGGGGSPR